MPFVLDGLVFAGARTGITVFLMAEPDEPPSGRRDAPLTPGPTPGRVPLVRR